MTSTSFRLPFGCTTSPTSNLKPTQPATASNMNALLSFGADTFTRRKTQVTTGHAVHFGTGAQEEEQEEGRVELDLKGLDETLTIFKDFQEQNQQAFSKEHAKILRETRTSILHNLRVSSQRIRTAQSNGETPDDRDIAEKQQLEQLKEKVNGILARHNELSGQ